jgi:hypothetical protein
LPFAQSESAVQESDYTPLARFGHDAPLETLANWYLSIQENESQVKEKIAKRMACAVASRSIRAGRSTLAEGIVSLP